MSVSEILKRLRALHQGPLPRWVEIKVRAWGKYYGDAAIQTITLVQIKDHATLQELLAEPEVAGLLKSFDANKGRALAVVDSAGKSLHGWYPVYNLTESQAAAFFGKAVALGADQSVYDKCKLVRMPGGLRDGARRQRIVYYDEEALP